MKIEKSLIGDKKIENGFTIKLRLLIIWEQYYKKEKTKGREKKE